MNREKESNSISSCNSDHDFDIVVIGAGPSGCEASIAAARRGASVLCLTINLDMVGYPPATPVLVDDCNDRRHNLLSELAMLGGQLPKLLKSEDIVSTDKVIGRVLIDRRRLGLAWKEQMENEDGVALRQGLVVKLEASEDGWKVETNFGENFRATAVIVAAGTFLHGRVIDSGREIPGGRWAEIPSDSLVKSLQKVDIELLEVSGRTSPRISSRSLQDDLKGRPQSPTGDPRNSEDMRFALSGDPRNSEDVRFAPSGDPRNSEDMRFALSGDPRIRVDGSQPGEVLGFGLETTGNRASQLEELRKLDGFSSAWITRGSYAVLHLVLTAGQVGENLEAIGKHGLFFSGRAAGSCNYSEAAVLGFIAGVNAASYVLEISDSLPLTTNLEFVTLLIERIAHKGKRPVTIRIDDETGC